MENKYEILKASENLLCVIDKNAIVYLPYIMKGTDIFNPRDEYKPITPGRERRLKSDFHEEAETLIREARTFWKPAPASTSTPAIPASTPMPITAGNSNLESVIASAISGAVVTQVKPQVDEYIRENYGALPKRIEIKSGYETRKITGIVHEKYETVLNLVNARIPVFLTGPAGSGKNVICQQVAEGLGLDFYFSNAVTQEYKLTGFIDANGNYHKTQFRQAFENGGLFMLDEIDASTPEVLVMLNAALSNGYFDFPTGKITAHDDFRVIAAGNTFGTGADIEYTGRYQLDASSLDRFALVRIDYDQAIENALSQGNEELTSFIQAFRNAVTQANFKFIVSYRAIERIASVEKALGKETALRVCLLKSIQPEDLSVIMPMLPVENPYTSELRKSSSRKAV